MTGVASLIHRLCIEHIAAKREPDFIVGASSPDGAYLQRWYITPWRGWYQHVAPADRTRWQRFAVAFSKRLLPNLYLHQFLRDDEDRALHDHPSWALSFMLQGSYREHTIAAGGIHQVQQYNAGDLRFMHTRHTHRIELLRADSGNPFCDYAYDEPVPCWTLFLFGPTVREWGFHCPQRGWVPWQEFTAPGKPGEVGRGCD